MPKDPTNPPPDQPMLDKPGGSLQKLEIAEIRASIQDRRSQYPVALNGLNVRSLHFYEDPESGMHRRHYVPGGGDPDSGIFPLEQARGDMVELQHAGNAAHLVVWEFFTPEEYAKSEKQKRDAIAAYGAQEAARIEALAKAREDEAQAKEKVGQLQKPGAVVPEDERGKGEAPPATEKKNSGKLKAALDCIGGK